MVGADAEGAEEGPVALTVMQHVLSWIGFALQSMVCPVQGLDTPVQQPHSPS